MIKILYCLNFFIIGLQNKLLKLLIFFLYGYPRKETTSLLVFRSGGLGDFIFTLPAIDMVYSFYDKDLYFMNYYPDSSKHFKELKKKNLTDLQWLKFLSQEKFNDTFILRGYKLNDIKYFRKVFKGLGLNGLILLSHPAEPFTSILKKLFLLRILGIKRAKVSGWKKSYSYTFFRKHHTNWGFTKHANLGPVSDVLSFFESEKSSPHEAPFPKVHVSDKDKHNVESYLYENHINNYLVISPGSVHELKNWGSENYEKLISRLLFADKNINILISGPKSDSLLANSLSSNKRVLNICGRFNLSELLIIYKKALCVYANDGGAAHLAALADAKVIVFGNGSQEPGTMSPHAKNVIELRKHTNCTPCFNYTECKLGRSKCVKDISIEEAFSAFEFYLDTSN